MILQSTSIILVVSTLLIVWAKSIMNSIRILSIQSLFLSFACLSLAWETGLIELYVMAALTLIVKAIIVPRILSVTMRRINIKREAEKLIGREVSLLCAAGLVVFSFIITNRLEVITPGNEHAYLPDAIAISLIGLFVMITHRKAIMQGIGLIIIENGLFLFALSTASGMPFIVDIGIYLDVLVTVALISILSYRMNQTFKSISTDWLRKLKG